MGGHTRVRWQIDGTRVYTGSPAVLASLAQRLAKHYGEAAPRAVNPQELWARLDMGLEEHPDNDPSKPLLAVRLGRPCWPPGAAQPRGGTTAQRA